MSSFETSEATGESNRLSFFIFIDAAARLPEELAAGGDIFAEKLAEYACGGAGIPSADSHRALFISVDERHLPPVIDFAASINNATALSMEQAERWRRCAPDDFNEGCWLRETCASMDLN